MVGINSFEDRSLEKIIKIAEKHDFMLFIVEEVKKKSLRLQHP